MKPIQQQPIIEWEFLALVALILVFFVAVGVIALKISSREEGTSLQALEARIATLEADVGHMREKCVCLTIDEYVFDDTRPEGGIYFQVLDGAELR